MCVLKSTEAKKSNKTIFYELSLKSKKLKEIYSIDASEPLYMTFDMTFDTKLKIISVCIAPENKLELPSVKIIRLK